MFEKLREKYNKRLAEGLIELDRRRAKKEERLKKKQQSMKRGSISYGLAMHQKPWEVYHAVLEKRRYEREQKKKT
jgi:hypothetical protein